MQKRFCIVSLIAILAVALGWSPILAADYTFKLGVVTPTDHPHSISSQEFAKMVMERSGNRIDVKVFDNAKLGSNPELLDGVKTGVIDLCVNTPGVMASYYPITGLLELPYLFTSKDHMLKVTRGEIGLCKEYRHPHSGLFRWRPTQYDYPEQKDRINR